MNTKVYPKNKKFSPPRKRENKQTPNLLRSTKACLEGENSERKAYENMLFTTLFNGELTHLSFDCPKPLRQTFKQTVKANGSSVCHVLQTFMVTYLVANHYQKACFNDTYRHPITVQHLVVPTYVKERVRRVKTVERVEEITERVVKEPKPLPKHPDFSKLPLNELDKFWNFYSRNPGKYAGARASLAYELKKRGVIP